MKKDLRNGLRRMDVGLELSLRNLRAVVNGSTGMERL